MLSETCKVLIGTDPLGRPLVLATDSSYVAYLVSEVAVGCEDIGLCCKKDCPRPGLYLAEGKWVRKYYGPEDDPQDDFEGTVRPVQPYEVLPLYAMTPPPEED